MVLGVLLILASFFPIGDLVAKSQWTREDSATYDKIATQYKRSAYQPAARQGLSEAELAKQRKKMERRLQAMEQQLQRAREQPKRWSRYLLWGGVAVLAIGLAFNARQRA